MIIILHMLSYLYTSIAYIFKGTYILRFYRQQQYKITIQISSYIFCTVQLQSFSLVNCSKLCKRKTIHSVLIVQLCYWNYNCNLLPSEIFETTSVITFCICMSVLVFLVWLSELQRFGRLCLQAVVLHTKALETDMKVGEYCLCSQLISL